MVLLHQLVPAAKMLKVLVKMQKVLKKMPVEEVLQEKVVKKEQRKRMKHLLKVRIITSPAISCAYCMVVFFSFNV